MRQKNTRGKILYTNFLNFHNQNSFFGDQNKILYLACSQVRNGVYAIFGPSDPLLGSHIHSICDALDIPHLETRVDLDNDFREFSINLYPAQNYLNKAFEDVMSFLNWTRVAIIYEEDYGLFLLHNLLVML